MNTDAVTLRKFDNCTYVHHYYNVNTYDMHVAYKMYIIAIEMKNDIQLKCFRNEEK